MGKYVPADNVRRALEEYSAECGWQPTRAEMARAVRGGIRLLNRDRTAMLRGIRRPSAARGIR